MKARYILAIMNFAIWFGLLCLVFLPFPYYLFPYQEELGSFIFNWILHFLAENIFGIYIINPGITSDSAYFYLLLFLLFVVSIIWAAVLSFSKKWKEKRAEFFTFCNGLFCFYLSLQLMKYGFDKIFKGQFYLPEPNILYTPLGILDKDILFWSTIGTSYSYNLFLGLMEVIPAFFLLFRKTRIIGLIISTGVLIHVVAINFCFDISVKVYSLFLLFLSLFLLFPFLKTLYVLLVKEQSTKIVSPPSLIRNKRLYYIIKSLAIAVILMECLMPYFRTGYFNDDKVPRPYLHGAYEVSAIAPDTIRAKKIPVIKRLFIHRRGYIIFQSENDEMADYGLDIDQVNGEFILTNYDLQQTRYHYSYDAKNEMLELLYEDGNLFLTAHAIDWRSLPVMQKKFHWTVDVQ